ncbi:MAG: hypothetical protein H0S79_13130 [Anaerolineaceae bacterium]|jgi:hypothetical protein|nr:hypothetical protein [Anaerolineaceae bacterium]
MSDQNIPNPRESQDTPTYVVNQPIEGPKKTKAQQPHHEGWLGSITWALVLIWAGLVFLASNFGWLDTIRFAPSLPAGIEFFGLGTWSLICLGAGVLLFVESLLSTFVPSLRSGNSGNFFLAAVFLGIGLSSIFGWDLIWPLVLILLGLSALASALIKRK